MIGELTLALSLDENDSDVHRVLAAVNLTVHRDHDKALYHQERALALNPNDDLIVVQQGEVLTWIGQAEEGIEWIQKAMRLNPYHPERFWSHLGRAYFVARRYGEAVKAFQRHQPRRPQPLGVSRGLPRAARRRSGGQGRDPGGAATGAGLLDRALHRDAALQARKRPRAPPRRARQGAIAGVTRKLRRRISRRGRPANDRCRRPYCSAESFLAPFATFSAVHRYVRS